MRLPSKPEDTALRNPTITIKYSCTISKRSYGYRTYLEAPQAPRVERGVGFGFFISRVIDLLNTLVFERVMFLLVNGMLPVRHDWLAVEVKVKVEGKGSGERMIRPKQFKKRGDSNGPVITWSTLHTLTPATFPFPDDPDSECPPSELLVNDRLENKKLIGQSIEVCQKLAHWDLHVDPEEHMAQPSSAKQTRRKSSCFGRAGDVQQSSATPHHMLGEARIEYSASLTRVNT